MKDLSFYEQSGILIPGSVFLFATILFIPSLRPLFADSAGITVGGLGVFLLVAYAAGHAIGAVGNALESFLWWCFGGMPTDWVTRTPPWPLNAAQVALLQIRIKERLDLEVAIAGLSIDAWAPIYGQLYRDVLANNPGRVVTFNGNYGLNRGLAAALVSLVPVIMITAPVRWDAVVLGVVVLFAIYLYRTYRFGLHFSQEVYFNFLNLPKKKPSAPNEISHK